jgi:hypothetical protein
VWKQVKDKKGIKKRVKRKGDIRGEWKKNRR